MAQGMRGDPRNPSETEFRATVIEAAERLGWKVWSINDSVYRALIVANRKLGIHFRPPAAGFPDLVMVRGDRLVFAELKSNTGTVRPEHKVWLDALAELRYPVEVHIWRPREFDCVLEVLE
jgi:hypothetical protein